MGTSAGHAPTARPRTPRPSRSRTRRNRRYRVRRGASTPGQPRQRPATLTAGDAADDRPGLPAALPAASEFQTRRSGTRCAATRFQTRGRARVCGHRPPRDRPTARARNAAGRSEGLSTRHASRRQALSFGRITRSTRRTGTRRLPAVTLHRRTWGLSTLHKSPAKRVLKLTLGGVVRAAQSFCARLRQRWIAAYC